MSDSDSRLPPGRPRRTRHTAKEHGPDPIDLHVGGQLRMARELAGLTQTEVGRDLGMSFQVIQKYEQGEIRISASRLYQLAVLLGKSPDYFFDGIAGSDSAERSARSTAWTSSWCAPSARSRMAELRQLLVRLARDIVEKNRGTSTIRTITNCFLEQIVLAASRTAVEHHGKIVTFRGFPANRACAFSPRLAPFRPTKILLSTKSGGAKWMTA